ncbi:Ktr system potassium uptake protein B [bacterium HR17]|uniref:Ktr system potassium uptake protein B n=1 Tax=Candidatus Fervidibacter japonicus TaxID=2035412 RepID=A0A2H5XDV3_9BACT|nr:Ktr system potassium uptake protein B [bacterium HR17]
MAARWRPAVGTLASFAALIAVGTVVLWLPVSAAREPLAFVDALFLATSAVCVTGLTPIDPGRDLSPLGQGFLLLLIQLGGLGYMTVAAFVAVALRRRLSAEQRAIVGLLHGDWWDARQIVRHVIGFTFLAEALGALALFIALDRYELPWTTQLWFSVFHSVSAFCNAGLDVFGAVGAERGWGGSLQPFARDPLVLLPIAALIGAGGLGFLVVAEIADRVRQRRFRWSVHLRVVVTVNAILWCGGALLLWLFEASNLATLGQQPLPVQILNAFFHAVAARTAGFAAVPIGEMTATSLWLLCLLMFIGASPGGTGGGIKTTTAAVLAAAAWAGAVGYDQVVLFRRSVPNEQLAKALALTLLAAHTVGGTTLLLCLTEQALLQSNTPYTFLDLLFEAVSAFGTVGLSTGVTPALSGWGKLLLVATMFVGRIGLLTVIVAVAGRPTRTVRFAREEVLIG